MLNYGMMIMKVTQATIQKIVDKTKAPTNPKLTKKTKDVFVELLNSNAKSPYLWLYRKDENAFMAFCGIRMDISGKVTFKQKLEFALRGYKLQKCLVCDEVIKTPREKTKTCHGSCSRLYASGGFIPQKEIKVALSKYGRNAQLTKIERKKLKSYAESKGTKPARKHILELDEGLDEKILTFKGKYYSERMATALLESKRPRCKCGAELNYRPSTNDFAQYCSVGCAHSCGIRSEKIKQTTILRHGGVGFQLEKTKKTMLERYLGNPSKCSKVKLMKVKTTMRNHGVLNPSCSAVVQQLKEKRSMVKYGYRSPNQHPEVIAKVMRNSFYRKEIQTEGRVLIVQGYEPFAFNYLIKHGIEPSDINAVCECTVPPVLFENKIGRGSAYYADFYIPKKNLLVEVKSTYTLAPNKETWKLNISKFKAAKKSGFNLVVLVMDQKGNRLRLPSGWSQLSYTGIRKALKEAVHRSK